MEKKKNSMRWQPVVNDNDGTIRKRFNELKKSTHIEKPALAEKIFLLGLPLLEKEASK